MIKKGCDMKYVPWLSLKSQDTNFVFALGFANNYKAVVLACNKNNLIDVKAARLEFNYIFGEKTILFFVHKNTVWFPGMALAM